MRKPGRPRKSEAKPQPNHKNLGGRPRKEVSVTENLWAYVVKNPYVMQQIVKAWIEAITKRGNVQAIQELLNRLEGRVIEKHEIDNKQSITIVFQPVRQSLARVIDKETEKLELGQGADIIEGEVIQES